MDNKYYQPTIEEFYVAFNYQQYQKKEWNKLISPPKDLAYKWADKTFNTSTSLSKIINLITGANGMDWFIDGVDQEHPSQKIRVKYLCEQDILDLGFKHANNDLDLVKTVKDKINKIRFRTIDNEPHLRIYEKSEKSYKDEWLTIFIGKIKNKNELIKLLKQLEIK